MRGSDLKYGAEKKQLLEGRYQDYWKQPDLHPYSQNIDTTANIVQVLSWEGDTVQFKSHYSHMILLMGRESTRHKVFSYMLWWTTVMEHGWNPGTKVKALLNILFYFKPTSRHLWVCGWRKLRHFWHSDALMWVTPQGRWRRNLNKRQKIAIYYHTVMLWSKMFPEVCLFH